MAQEKWITEMLAQNVRRDLHRLPPASAGCFYGNPLGGMAKPFLDWVPKVCLRDTGVTYALWADLQAMEWTSKTSAEFDWLASRKPDYFKLLMFWEWLRALDELDADSRWRSLDGRPQFVKLVWQGYEVAMLRALKFSGATEDDPDLVPCLPIDGVQHPRDVASFLHGMDETQPFKLCDVPTHVALLARLRISSKGPTPKGTPRGEHIHADLLTPWKMAAGTTADTPGGMHLKNGYGIGGKTQAIKGRSSSPTAQLIVATGIEKFLRSRHNYNELMQAAWSNNTMSKPTPIDSHDKLSSPEAIAKKLITEPRQNRAGHRFAMTSTTEDTFSQIKAANAVWEDGQIQIEFPLTYQDWMSDQLLDAVVVIQTWGDIDGQRQTETIFATVLSAEDADKSGDTLAVKVCALFSQTPLLNLWDQAKPRKRHIQGVITLWNIEGEKRVVLGLEVYLGEMESLPTRYH